MPEVPQGDGDTLSFGAYLRQSRALRELSLDDVAKATKLPARIVEALESDDFDTLQDRAHALLFARSYAAAIGLDPEETALRLEEELMELEPDQAARAPLWARLWDRRPREPLVWIVVAVTLLAIAALFFKRH